MDFPFAKSFLLHLIFLSCLPFGAVIGQQNLLRFEHIHPDVNEYEGLVSGMQDHLGYIWLGTTNGLIRHDAQGFKLWANDPDDPWSLPGNDVAEVVEISDSLMWVVTKYTGLARFNRRNSRFTIFKHDPNAPSSVSRNHLHTIQKGPKSSWWLGSTAGLQLILPETILGEAKFQSVSLTERPEGDPGVNAIVMDEDRNTWLAGTNGLWLVEATQLRLLLQNPARGRVQAQEFLPEERILNLLHEKGIGTWICGLNGIWFWPEAAVKVRDPSAIVKIPLEMGGPATTRHLILDSQDNLWFASNGQGLFRLTPAQRALRAVGTMRFERYDYNAEDPGSFVGGITNFLMEDLSGNIWGLSRPGLDMLNPQQTQFGHRKPNPADGGYSKEMRSSPYSLKQVAACGWVARMACF